MSTPLGRSAVTMTRRTTRLSVSVCVRTEMAHVKPHFNAGGGCRCKCRKCVRLKLTRGTTSIAIGEKCVCRGCSEDCPVDRLDTWYVERHSLDIEEAELTK